MARPKRRRKASLHSAGKVQEADLLARARALRDDPSLAAPICDGGCVLFSPVEAARRGIAKAHAARDDEAKLQRLSKGGNDLARAYAGMLLLARDDKIPYVAELKLAGMVAPYVVRGKAKPFFAAGLLNHHDRQLRLLAVTPWTKKRGLHFYSADRGIVCTGKRDAPPRDFVEEEAEELGLEGDGKRFTCGHEGDVLVLGWKSAGVTLERCSKCFDETPTLMSVIRHMAVPAAMRAFDVSVRLAPLRAGAGDAPNVDVVLPEAVVSAYKTGARSDPQLVEAAREARVAALRAKPGLLLVAGDAAYGADVDAFLAALGATGADAKALRAALSAHGDAVVLDKPTTARALAELWATHGRLMLEAVGGTNVAARLHKDKVGPDEAADLVRRAEREGAHASVVAALPRYRSLPPAAATADAVARAFRGGGAEMATRLAIERASGGKAKGVALAFLQALTAGKGQEWRFATTDHELAAALGPTVEILLRGDPASYHDALRHASLLAGETVDFAPER